MTDEKQEPDVVDRDEYLGVYDEMVRSGETERDATRRVLRMSADWNYQKIATLRAERDRLREAAEMADEALKAAMIEVPRPPVCRKITDAREKLRAALSRKGGGDG